MVFALSHLISQVPSCLPAPLNTSPTPDPDPTDPDSDLIQTWKGGSQVWIRSRTGQNQVRIRSGGRCSEGVGGKRGRSGLCGSEISKLAKQIDIVDTCVSAIDTPIDPLSCGGSTSSPCLVSFGHHQSKPTRSDQKPTKSWRKSDTPNDLGEVSTHEKERDSVAEILEKCRWYCSIWLHKLFFWGIARWALVRLRSSGASQCALQRFLRLRRQSLIHW